MNEEWESELVKDEQSSMISSRSSARNSQPWVEYEWESISVCQDCGLTHACLTELTPSAPGLGPVIEPTMTVNDADDDTAVPDSRSSSSSSSRSRSK